MKKLVDSNFDPHEVVESNPLKPTDKATDKKGMSKTAKTALIITVILFICAVVGYMLYNHNQNKEDGNNGK